MSMSTSLVKLATLDWIACLMRVPKSLSCRLRMILAAELTMKTLTMNILLFLSVKCGEECGLRINGLARSEPRQRLVTVLRSTTHQCLRLSASLDHQLQLWQTPTRRSALLDPRTRVALWSTQSLNLRATQRLFRDLLQRIGHGLLHQLCRGLCRNVSRVPSQCLLQFALQFVLCFPLQLPLLLLLLLHVLRQDHGLC